jgi:hypothetical protein
MMNWNVEGNVPGLFSDISQHLPRGIGEGGEAETTKNFRHYIHHVG